MDKELFLGLLTLEIFREQVVCREKTNNDQEEQTVVEIFIDHVVLVVRANARKDKIVSICKHLGSRLKFG